jgi:putative transposase
MCRLARVVLPGFPHHITQRGIRRFDIFRDRKDRELYLDLFEESSRRFGLRICAYCLMTNHVHFVGIPLHKDSIWKTFHRCHGVYAVKFNAKYDLAGHLFQGRPYSSVLDERHFWSAMRYVEQNPVRAGMVVKAEEHEWSSARSHCEYSVDRLLDANWIKLDQIANWKGWLREEQNDEDLLRIRSNTFTGRPCGDEYFVQRVEAETGRQLQPQKRGRPKPAREIESSPTLGTSDEIWL